VTSSPTISCCVTDGIVKVLDFGLAKLSRERQTLETDSLAPTQNFINTAYGMVLGTAHYMSPEQARGMELDVRTDIWSLGCVLYEMISGRQPFAAPTTIDIMSGILHRDPDPLLPHLPDGPRELDLIIRRALRKERDERYQTAKDFLIDLKDLKRAIETQSHRVLTRDPQESHSPQTPCPTSRSPSLLREHELGKRERLLLRRHDGRHHHRPLEDQRAESRLAY
jgi:serine/threonine protein kinase